MPRPLAEVFVLPMAAQVLQGLFSLQDLPLLFLQLICAQSSPCNTFIGQIGAPMFQKLAALNNIASTYN